MSHKIAFNFDKKKVSISTAEFLLCLNDLLWSQNNTFKLSLREHIRLLTISFVSGVKFISYL